MFGRFMQRKEWCKKSGNKDPYASHIYLYRLTSASLVPKVAGRLKFRFLITKNIKLEYLPEPGKTRF
jgi:hypothetical protein